MIKYKKYKNNNEHSHAFGKWYARAVHELMEFDEFIEHMAKHHCVFSEATIRGVIIEMEVCLREMLLEGKAVRLDDLGIFTVGLITQGMETSDKFTANCIKGVGVNLYLGKRFRARNLFADAKFKEADKYIGDGNYYDPDDGDENASVDGDPDSQGGSENGGSSSTGNAGTTQNSGSQSGGSTNSGSNSGSGTNTGGSTGGNTGGNSGSQSGTEGDYRLVIYKYGNGTSTVTDDSEQEINSNDNVHSGSNVNVSVTSANDREPIVKVNGIRIILTENDGTYTGSFQMPTKGTVLEINSEPGEWDDVDLN